MRESELEKKTKKAGILRRMNKIEIKKVLWLFVMIQSRYKHVNKQPNHVEDRVIG